MENPLIIYLIAGEASGDSLGAGLMQALREQMQGKVIFHGIGGEKMQAQGLKSLFPYSDLSVMGFAEILPHMLKLLTRIEQAADDIEAKHPDVVISIDSPGFTLRVAKKVQRLRARGMKLVHYVAPTVWAYKPERAAACAALFDHMLLLLPFEPPYFTKEGLACTYVGHPSVWRGNPRGDAQGFYEKYQIPPEAPVISLLPGSRLNEVKRHMPVFAGAMLMAAESRRLKDMVLAVPVPRSMLESVVPFFEGCPFRTVLVSEDEDRRNAIAASRFALVKSGTISMEVAYQGTPMIIAYRANRLSAWIVKRLISIRFVNLINIVRQKEVIPEFLQDACNAPFLANAGSALLAPDSQIEQMREEIRHAIDGMQPPTSQAPAQVAAGAIISLVRPEKKELS